MKEKKKANPLLLLISILLLVSSLILNTQSDGSCRGGGEGDLLSEEESISSRRSLWGSSPTQPMKRYISYEALRGDNVPCNRPGVPYYNCRVLPKANTYTRGCSVITACRG